MDLRIHMTVSIPNGSSTAHSSTDRLGPGPRTKHIDTRYFGARTSTTRRSEIQESSYSEKLWRFMNEAPFDLQSSLQQQF